MSLSPRRVRALIADEMFPAWQAERARLDNIDNWMRWNHDKPHAPRQATLEYQQLADRSEAPWLGLIVTTAVQQLYGDGYRQRGASEDTPAWRAWQANGMDARQIPLHRAALGYGYAFQTVTPGVLAGEQMPVMRGVSPRQMIAFYVDPTSDDWPAYALHVTSAKINGSPGYRLRLYDDTEVHELTMGGPTEAPEYLDSQVHDIGICPVVRFANQVDLEGRCDGEVEPFIPLAARIDQTSFDRLVVQRFASWVVRTIAGMAKPESATDTAAEKLRLAVEGILVASDPDTKFGSLPATPLDGFIKAHEADVKTLAALTQTPAHEMLGQMANLSAEALAAAEASLTRKVEERKHTLGEAHEQSLRLCASLMGDTDGATDYSAELRWRDMESRSLSQAADALGKLAEMLKVPVEMLWTKIPGFTDADVAEAKRITDEGGGLAAILEQLANGQTTDPDLVPVA